MSTMRNIIEINEDLCNGCGQCILDCAEGAIHIVDGKAKVIADHLCDGLGACLSGCPTGALKIIQRPADAYDEKAVEEHLARQGKAHGHTHGHGHKHGHGGCPSAAPGGGCPSSRPMNLPMGPGGMAAPSGGGNTHWPLKLRLMSPDAPFLQGARLLLAADCTAFAAPGLQALKPGRVCLIACPKFEGMEPLVERLVEIFTRANPAEVLVARMEVPCCQVLSRACAVAKEQAGSSVPVTEVIVTRTGEVKL